MAEPEGFASWMLLASKHRTGVKYFCLLIFKLPAFVGVNTELKAFVSKITIPSLCHVKWLLDFHLSDCKGSAQPMTQSYSVLSPWSSPGAMLAEVLLSRGRLDAQAQEPFQEILQGAGHWGWWEAPSRTAWVAWGWRGESPPHRRLLMLTVFGWPGISAAQGRGFLLCLTCPLSAGSLASPCPTRMSPTSAAGLARSCWGARGASLSSGTSSPHSRITLPVNSKRERPSSLW